MQDANLSNGSGDDGGGTMGGGSVSGSISSLNDSNEECSLGLLTSRSFEMVRCRTILDIKTFVYLIDFSKVPECLQAVGCTYLHFFLPFFWFQWSIGVFGQ
jgi:hypothetical protein